MLRDITIENYRLFEKFHLEGMTQLNLLVGTNNSGKSSLLEAIYLLVNNEDPTAIFDVLDSRSEFIETSHDQEVNFQISEVFRGHQLQKNCRIVISSQEDQRMSLEYTYVDDVPYAPLGDESAIRLIFREPGKVEASVYFPLEDSIFAGGYTAKEGFQDRLGIDNRFITTEHLRLRLITKLWNQIVLMPKEDMVMEALRILEPNLERMALTNQATPEMSVRLKIKGNDTPVLLGSMGDGMYRILALVMSLVNCEGGALLVDEIDTGLHYKALTQMWHLVIEMAKKLNVQAFATTHSWDCLVSFHKALSEMGESNLGTVFRLERKNGQIDYVSYTGEELATAVEHDIEVR